MDRKVLLVEDEAAIRKFTKIKLEKSGFNVLEAGSGEEGVEIAFAEKPDIVILDIMLPGIDGYEVCKILRNRMPAIGIIMLTAKSQEVDRIMGLEQGTDDYLNKPFNPEELVLRIKALIRRLDYQNVKPKNHDALEDGPFKLDFYSKRLSKNGVNLDLTPTELALVKIFMTNKDKAFTRAELMDLAWGKDFNGDDKIIDVNIRRIRAKIEDNPANPVYLQTVRSVGYRWGR